MRVMYVAPRYHTNQTAIMKGWLDHGDEVYFLSQYAGKSEDYTYIKPEIIGYSGLFRIINYLYTGIFKRKDPYGNDWKLKYGFPPLLKVKKYFDEIKPDVVIIRERSVYSICINSLCKRYGIPAILYNQSPLWDKPEKPDWKHRLVWKLVPDWRITPVFKKKMSDSDLVRSDRTLWLPFVMEPQLDPDQKKYFCHNRINILSIGKYQERKNHLMLIQIIENLRTDNPVHLTIAGECSNHFHQEYYEQLKQYIEEHNLEDFITLEVNLNRDQVFQLYRTSDIFVLSSTDEPAAVSHLEAMAFSVPAFSGTGNGTADYIEDGVTGFIFQDNNREDLKEKLEYLVNNKSDIIKMGRAAYDHVQKEFQFQRYYEGIMEILK